MTDKTIDETISEWLEAEAPRQLPDRVLRATYERTRKSRQQLRWRGVPGRRQTPRFIPALGGAAVAVMAAVLALNFIAMFGTGRPPTPAPSPAPSAKASPSTSPRPTPPPVEADVAALLNGFLEARVAGKGAEQYVNADAPDHQVPLLYATASGVPYERAEFDQVLGIEWPYGFTAFKARLFAGDTVVEQLLFISHEGGRLGLEYQRDGFGTDIAPTTENGRPVAMPYEFFGGEVTVQVAHPWIMSGPSVRLIPQGPGVLPTTDGGQRREWDRLVLMADPALIGTDCNTGLETADAAALAARIRSEPNLNATSPVAVSARGADGLWMDVRIAAGAILCDFLDEQGNELHQAVLSPVWDADAVIYANYRRTWGHATGDWMRLYLFDAPEGSPIRILAIAIVAPESRFQRAVEAAAPVVESVEYSTN
jgi:hypothetical protein